MNGLYPNLKKGKAKISGDPTPNYSGRKKLGLKIPKYPKVKVKHAKIKRRV